ncbi:MAG: ATP-dependent DNA helicase [Cyanothece sp. SIO2G6]|nr:ATP-dependent DNA helicase [Cyanothece sp. SIO2G6]
MIEVEVHQQLRAFLREQGESLWPHHLTMARLVARALRIDRSALIQSGVSASQYAHYRLSYLMPALLWSDAVIVVAPETIRNRLVMVDIPRLQQWMSTDKPIHVSPTQTYATGEYQLSAQSAPLWPQTDFNGLLITSPTAWLSDRLSPHTPQLPPSIPTVIDGADDLEQWVQQQLTLTLHPHDWDALMLACPAQAEAIRDIRIWLTHSIFQHPPNPYSCHLLEEQEQERLRLLEQILQAGEAKHAPYIPAQWSSLINKLYQQGQLLWTSIDRIRGQFSLHCTPLDLAPLLTDMWQQQALVLIGNALDQSPQATAYRQRIGLGDLTCVKFAPDRHQDLIQLYLPDQFPLPNTPQFQTALLQKVRQLICTSADAKGLTVILVGDTPLKSQLATILAAEFGSRLQVEQTCLEENGILVSGWQFWREHHGVLPAPTLLIMPTLPIPSLEDPLVAGRVSCYKRQHKNWFTDYLLPETLKEIQRAIAPLRNTQGVMALLDNRVNYRSYGSQVLDVISPFARTNYIDEQLFSSPSRPVLDER